jgi:hypothetical protein
MAERQPQGAEKYLGREVVTSDGQKVGIGARLLKNRVNEIPEWLVVEAGLLGRRRYIVPLAGSDLGDDRVTIPYTSDVVSAQPHVEPDEDANALPLDAEDALNQYFGLGANHQ